MAFFWPYIRGNAYSEIDSEMFLPTIHRVSPTDIFCVLS